MKSRFVEFVSEVLHRRPSAQGMARRAGGMVFTLAVVVVILVALAWIFSGNKQPSTARPGPATSPSPVETVAVDEHPWPALAPAQEQADVATDLMANNYYVVLDGSGSMRDAKCSGERSKMTVAKEALLAFASSLPARSNLGLAVFDRKGLSERIALSAVDVPRLTRTVGEVRAKGNTPLSDALSLAYAQLETQGRRQLGYGEYHLVVVTDGRATEGQDPTRVVQRVLGRSPLVLHTIGFCIRGDHSLNQKGQTYYRAADNPQALAQGLEEVLAEAPDFTVTTFD